MANSRLRDLLGLKDISSSYFLRAPQEYWQALGIKQDPYNDVTSEYDFIHAFFTNKTELSGYLDILASKLTPSGSLWISWPKLSSGTDITDDILLDLAKEHGLVSDGITIDITENWQGTKLALHFSNN